jgi:uncharacterized protein
MDRTLTNFIKAMRAADVPVSIGESIDALKTVSVTGYDNRQFMKDALSCVVAKTPEEKDIFDNLFELYFSRDLAQEEALQNQYEPGEGGDPSSAQPGEGDGDAVEQLREMMEGGSPSALAQAMERAAEQVGVENIRFSTQRGIMARRMLDEMGMRELEARMIELRGTGDSADGEESEALSEIRNELIEKARNYVEQQYKIFGEAATERFMEDYIQKARLTEIGPHDMERLQTIIRKIAKRLAQKHSRRRKRRNRGQLNIRKTMRENASTEGIPFKTIWKQKKRERAKVVAICDVSGSVAAYARFLLMLLYGLNEVIPDIKSFAFSHKLVDISDQLEDNDVKEAVKEVIKEVGQGSTDYGAALGTLQTDHWDTIDRRTTVIILGDGRSNYGNPRIDVMRELQAQAKKVIWLCPEHPSMWGTGDSEIPRFRPFCTLMQQCRTVKDLERVVDMILASYTG